ncbi:MAG: deoxynucleoside kinase [Acidobacteria bacterium]|nr:deoxynucleoside kinase [Acidobacteriota bacterium]
MEQGRRLLNAQALSAVAKFLNIPDDIVAPFRSPAFQDRRNKVSPEPASFVPFRVLCVSGISGSGKTTLADVISRTFGVKHIGSHPSGRAYLKDLSDNKERWAFEAQVAFLTAKTSQIRQSLDRGHSLVVERWIDEDISVYERLFEETGAIDGRGQETFKMLGELARELLPSPEYHILCECEAETAFKRINTRNRSDSPLHA